MSTKLADAVNAADELNRKLAKLLEDSVKPVLNAIAETGEVDLIYVYGYTPGFNDGEPCEHTTDFYVNFLAMYSEYIHERSLIVENSAVSDRFGDDFWEAAGARDEIPYVSYSAPPDKRAEYEEKVRKCEEALADACPFKWEDPQNDLVDRAIENIIVPALDKEFGTDYQVLYVRDGNKFIRFDDEYSCGY